jgi:hypothetical protein
VIADGAPGSPWIGADHFIAGGGGSGGGVLLSGEQVFLNGAVAARGGDGGCDDSAEVWVGAGGGGGGRIKIFYQERFTLDGNLLVHGGAGGCEGGTYPGYAGQEGTINIGRHALNLKFFQVDFGESGTAGDGYRVEGTFAPDEHGDGISPLTEDVTTSVGTSEITIPAGSFRTEGERYVYRGVIDGAEIQASFEEIMVAGFWKFVIKADLVGLSGTSNPAPVMLTVGDDQAEALARLRGDLVLDNNTLIEHQPFFSDGDLTLGGEYHFTIFHIQEGHTLYVEPGKPLSIIADEIAIDGMIDATGVSRYGRGRGGGGFYCASGGGAGYGGKGGDAFRWCQMEGGGGGTYGTVDGETVEMGSYGGSAYADGGLGGGAVSLLAGQLVINGAVVADGDPGVYSGDFWSGGGGSGGGVLLAGNKVQINGPVSAAGGTGGCGYNGSSVPLVGGGGGGGGRIKVHYQHYASTEGELVVQGGGGGCADRGYPWSEWAGQPGQEGTVHLEQRNDLSSFFNIQIGVPAEQDR